MAANSASTLDNNLTPGGTNSQGLADWAAPYVTNYLSQAQALGETPYQTYQGPLTAGTSNLQNQAFQGIAGLTVPSAIGDATVTAGNVANTVGKMSYAPTTFGNQYQAPAAYQAPNFTNQYQDPKAYQSTAFTNQYQAPQDYQAANFTNQYKAPQDYKSVGSLFGAEQAQQYMNPFLQMSLDPQLEEARRQSQITQMQNNQRLTSAGAFGGGRQAIMDAETQRNLGTNLANITGAGYNTAFTNAQQQFNADQARKIQEAQFGAQQGMTAAQMQAQYGLSAQQANEASRQFGQQQKMSAAQLQAQYGLTAQQASEMSRQFGSTQRMSAAQLQAQYGLSAEQANEAAKQFGAQQDMTAAGLRAQYGLAGQQAGEASKQFGSTFGLNAQNAALNAANIQGQLGLTQNQANLANLNAQLGAGAAERGITAEGIAADQAEFEKQRQFPYQQVQFQRDMISGMPISSLSNTPGSLTGIGSLFSSLGGATGVASALGYKDVNQLLKKIGLDLGL